MNLKEWTVMIYMAGDNNLAVDMAYAMEQIKQAAGPDGPNLFVYYDGNSPAIPTMYCDFSEPQSPRYYRSYKIADKLFPTSPKPNENASDPKSVLNFIDWCLNKAPSETQSGPAFGRRARKYALIFSGHSLGFQDIGLFRDETSGKAMKMKDLFAVLKRASQTADEIAVNTKNSPFGAGNDDASDTVLFGQKLDILGFDSCVMGMLEVGFQFRDTARIMISSEGSVPSAGWTYARILGNLASDSAHTSDPESVAAAFVRDFIRSYDRYTFGGISVDLAAWDLSRLRDVAVSLDGLSAALLDAFAETDSPLYQSLARSILHAHYNAQTYMYDQNVDLADFCRLLDAECKYLSQHTTPKNAGKLSEISEHCRKVISEVQRTVLLSGHSGGAYQFSNGISAFFPWSMEAYDVSRKNYESLWIVKDSPEKKKNWNVFLQKYLSDISRRKPVTASGTTNDAQHTYFSGIRFEDERRPAAVSAVVGAVQEGSKIAGQEGSKIAGQEGSKIAGQEGSKIAGQEGSKIAGQEGSKIAGQEGSKIAGQEGSKIAGQEGSKIAGQEGSKIAGQEGSKIAGQEGSKIAGQEGSKIAGQEGSKIAGQEGSKIAGQEGSKIAGQEGSKIAGQEGSKIAGQEGSKIAGQEGSKIAGQEGSKIAGQEGSKIAGQEGSKIAGQEGSKIAGQEGSKIAGQEGSKIAGQEGSKLAGQEGSKIAGQEGSKIAGQEGSKIAGQEGSKMAGAGASAFFESLRLYKNIEPAQNYSGFSKNPDDAITKPGSP